MKQLVKCKEISQKNKKNMYKKQKMQRLNRLVKNFLSENFQNNI